MAAEIERTKWTQFRFYLDKKDRKMFDQMYDYVKLNNAAYSNACRPVVIHAVLMSIIFEHYKQLTKLMEQGEGCRQVQHTGFVDLNVRAVILTSKLFFTLRPYTLFQFGI